MDTADMAGADTTLYGCACVNLACDSRLSLLTTGAYHRSEKVEIASGQILLVPLIGLAEWEWKIRVTSLNIEASARSAQMNFRSGLCVCEM